MYFLAVIIITGTKNTKTQSYFYKAPEIIITYLYVLLSIIPSTASVGC